MSIINHIMLGTNDLDKARKFYDDALGALGVKNLGPMRDTGFMYGVERPEFVITKPRDGKPACFANGGTLGFVAPNMDAVNKFHAAGLANGGSCEGEPGPRDFVPGAYGAYLRDPDGNKICAFSYDYKA